VTRQLIGRFADRVRPPEGAVDGLARREIEVLKLIAAGLSNSLVISLETVKTHMSRILAKQPGSRRWCSPTAPASVRQLRYR
jgi:ATP/maltotriose-dependent transcriptional regulator MalT